MRVRLELVLSLTSLKFKTPSDTVVSVTVDCVDEMSFGAGLKHRLALVLARSACGCLCRRCSPSSFTSAFSLI